MQVKKSNRSHLQATCKPPADRLHTQQKNPLSLDGLTRVGNSVISYEFQATDPLSLRERAGVRVIYAT